MAMSEPGASIGGTAVLAVAEVIEGAAMERDLRITKAQPGGPIEANLAAVKAFVDDQLTMYRLMTVDDEEAFALAKRDRTHLRKLIGDIDNERKKVKAAYMEPVAAFEDAVKGILEPAKQAEAAIAEEVKAYDERYKLRRRQQLSDHYDDYAPMLAAAVPYGRLHDDRWLNRSFDLSQAYADLEGKVGRIASEEATLSDLGLAHPIEAKARYYETLSVADAISYDKEMTRREEAARAIEEHKAAMAAEQEAAQAAQQEAAAAEPEPQPEPQPDDAAAAREDALGCHVGPVAAPSAGPAPPVPAGAPQEQDGAPCEWVIVATATKSQLLGLKGALDGLGIKGARAMRKAAYDAAMTEGGGL